MGILTYFSSHSRQVNVTTWFLVLPIDKNEMKIKIETVNTSTSPHISDQLGTEYAFNTVVLIYRHDMSSGLQ